MELQGSGSRPFQVINSRLSWFSKGPGSQTSVMFEGKNFNPWVTSPVWAYSLFCEHVDKWLSFQNAYGNITLSRLHGASVQAGKH